MGIQSLLPLHTLLNKATESRRGVNKSGWFQSSKVECRRKGSCVKYLWEGKHDPSVLSLTKLLFFQTCEGGCKLYHSGLGILLSWRHLKIKCRKRLCLNCTPLICLKSSLPKELDKNPPSKTCPKERQYFKISNIKKRKQTKRIQKKDTVMHLLKEFSN